MPESHEQKTCKYGGELTSILVATKQIEPGETHLLYQDKAGFLIWFPSAITNPSIYLDRHGLSVIGVGMPVLFCIHDQLPLHSIPENLVGLTISHGEVRIQLRGSNAGWLAAYELLILLIPVLLRILRCLWDDTEGTLTSSSVTLGLTPEQVPAVLSAQLSFFDLLFLGQD